MNQDNRRTLLIDPYFQKRFIAYMAGVSVAISAFYFFAITAFFWRFQAKGEEIGLSPDHIFFKFLDEQKNTLSIFFLAATICMVGGLIAHGFYLSNRIAGPLFRLNKYLQSIRSGTASEPLNVRSSDFFQGVFTEVNETIAVLKPSIISNHSELPKAEGSK